MDAITSDPVSAEVSYRTRAPVTSITNPWLDENSIHPNAEISFVSEKLQFLNGEKNAVLPAPPVIRKVVSVLGESVTFVSPVTGQEKTLYGADIAAALTKFYVKWYGEDRAAEVPTDPPADPPADPPMEVSPAEQPT
jgi:hypothetical protein